MFHQSLSLRRPGKKLRLKIVVKGNKKQSVKIIFSIHEYHLLCYRCPHVGPTCVSVPSRPLVVRWSSASLQTRLPCTAVSFHPSGNAVDAPETSVPKLWILARLNTTRESVLSRSQAAPKKINKLWRHYFYMIFNGNIWNWNAEVPSLIQFQIWMFTIWNCHCGTAFII